MTSRLPVRLPDRFTHRGLDAVASAMEARSGWHGRPARGTSNGTPPMVISGPTRSSVDGHRRFPQDPPATRPGEGSSTATAIRRQECSWATRGADQTLKISSRGPTRSPRSTLSRHHNARRLTGPDSATPGSPSVQVAASRPRSTRATPGGQVRSELSDCRRSTAVTTRCWPSGPAVRRTGRRTRRCPPERGRSRPPALPRSAARTVGPRPRARRAGPGG